MERYHVTDHVTKTVFRLQNCFWMCLSDSAHHNESIHIDFLHIRLTMGTIILGSEPPVIFCSLDITIVLVNIFAPNFQKMLRGSSRIYGENMKLKY